MVPSCRPREAFLAKIMVKLLRENRSIVCLLGILPQPKPSELTSSADLKRELISQQVKYEITELNSPTALQRFGAPFRSDVGEVSPLDSELPILRYIFVHHVREFPFLDKAKEKEFWQDKLQVVSFGIATILRSEHT